MKVKYFLPIILLSLFIVGCSTPSLVAEYTFQTDMENWDGGFSDFPAENEEQYESFVYDHKPLPSYLAENKNAVFISCPNPDDDVFMFMKHQLNENLKANTTYQIKFHIEIATNAPSGCAGVGGPPGEGVRLKAGASIIEPLSIIGGDGYYRMNVDKGTQTEGGKDAIVLGHIGNSSTDCLSSIYEIKKFDSPPFEITTDESATIWLLIGTDSAFESTTSLYYTYIKVALYE